MKEEFDTALDQLDALIDKHLDGFIASVAHLAVQQVRHLVDGYAAD